MYLLVFWKILLNPNEQLKSLYKNALKKARFLFLNPYKTTVLRQSLTYREYVLIVLIPKVDFS